MTGSQSYRLNLYQTGTIQCAFLSLKGEAHANLVGRLIQVLGIERRTETKGDARSENDVIGDGGQTAVIDLSLFC